LIRGRKEWGLVAASCFTDGGARRLYTAQYSAERSGTSLTVDAEMAEEGEAPPDRLPRVMTGVVRRSEVDLGEPRTVEIAGDPEKFREFMDEFDPSLLENLETVEKMETVENTETIENTETVENMGAVENTETVENMGAVENTETVETTEVVENIEVVSNTRTVENAET